MFPTVYILFEACPIRKSFSLGMCTQKILGLSYYTYACMNPTKPEQKQYDQHFLQTFNQNFNNEQMNNNLPPV